MHSYDGESDVLSSGKLLGGLLSEPCIFSSCKMCQNVYESRTGERSLLRCQLIFGGRKDTILSFGGAFVLFRSMLPLFKKKGGSKQLYKVQQENNSESVVIYFCLSFNYPSKRILQWRKPTNSIFFTEAAICSV